MSVFVQAQMLSLNRSSLYYKPVPPSEEEIRLKHAIDEIYTKSPYFGSRSITTVLKREGHLVSRSTVQKYMREMGLVAIHPGPNLSKRNHEHKVYPYLLRNITASYPNHIWGTDITYVRLRRGWLYLVAFLDWYSRYVVSWELSDNLEVDFVLSALEAGLKIGKPVIANSDQGSQFTSRRYIDTLINSSIQISMDGRGRALDNIFTERLWRSVKYQEIYINDYASPREARYGIGRYLESYNTYRPHQALKELTPAEVYFKK
ncbi:transposase [Candidatus Formimonas warabiya]|uniref:Transposase n=2 Tax=Formimonas warabiya TaxID=1761012 RepID=A0A3G1KUQ1_FORW1|nr:transposase [Candidatus Formimonas warabiya]ATW24154.1 transposase [Candidatus Formimonas warabiya]ATW24186.1 transposase [Candidatus Formimonas warabiya]ATW24636.1 transposase [Candidatus Formimonas warabiya]ATW24639.1 transposase [Candidatus Formimonas warabiya]